MQNSNSEGLIVLKNNIKFMNPYRKPSEFTEINPAVEEILKRERAREIMGDGYFGPEAVKTAFGIEVLDSEIPPLPHTREQLEQAKELGEMLILRVSHDNEGNLMTLKNIRKKVIEESGVDKNEISFLIRANYYDDFPFLKDDHPKKEWKLVRGSFVPDIYSEKDKKGLYVKDSTDSNYIHQTGLLREYLKFVGSLHKSEERECSEKIYVILASKWG